MSEGPRFGNFVLGKMKCFENLTGDVFSHTPVCSVLYVAVCFVCACLKKRLNVSCVCVACFLICLYVCCMCFV